MLKRYQFRCFPLRLVLYVVALTLFGIAVIGSAQESLQSKQMAGMVLGLVAMLVMAFVNYSFVLKFWWLIYAANLVLLLLVRFSPFGDDSLGARRWLVIEGFRFQPSEITKICLILFFAWFFGKYHEKINTFPMILLSGILIAIPLALILVQPDLSTSIATAMIFVGMIFLAGLSYKIILGILAVMVPAAVVLFVMILQPDQQILQGYQYTRIMAWLQPEKYPQDAYQQQNSIMAFGSGGLWGKGLNNDDVFSVKNGNFIPEPQTDFIYAVTGEELGFVGSAIVLVLLFLVVLECIMIGRKAKDYSGMLICGGVASLIGFQSFINICVVTGLFPNTGLTLPFLSYGLTSLVSLYIAIGLVINVALQPKKYRTGEEFL